MSTKFNHPSPETLSDFALRRLSDDEHAAVQDHVANCAECAVALKGTAHGGDTTWQPPAGGEFLAFDTQDQSAQTAARTSADWIPEELRSHPRYEVERVLGAGGMGVVYLAKHRLMDRRVVLKLINPQLIARSMAVKRFQREVRAAAKLSHVNIVAAHDAEQAGNLHFLVMEYVDGENLAELVRRQVRIGVEPACDYICQAAAGLQHAYEQGMIHRDIKPQNLMLTRDGQIKILDFGIARFAREENATQAEEGLTGENAMLGTPDYMAPEQVTDARSADIRADIYSLGCTLYYLLAGQPPFPEGTAYEKLFAHVNKQPRAITEVRDIEPALRIVLEQMMAKDPKQRFATPAEVVEALAGAVTLSTNREEMLPTTPIEAVTTVDAEPEILDAPIEIHDATIVEAESCETTPDVRPAPPPMRAATSTDTSFATARSPNRKAWLLWSLIAVACLVVGGVFIAAMLDDEGYTPRDEPITLRLNMQSGDKKTAVMSMKLNTEADAGFAMEMQMAMYMTFVVEDVDSDNYHIVRCTYDRITTDVSAFGTKKSYDSIHQDAELPKEIRALIGQSLTFKMTPLGEVVEVGGLDELAEALATQSPGSESQILQQTENQLGQVMATFPDRHVANGDTWTGTISQGGEMPMTVQATYTLMGREFGEAEIAVNGRISGALSGSMSGTFKVDLETGWTNSAETQMTAGGTVEGDSTKLDITMQLSTF